MYIKVLSKKCGSIILEVEDWGHWKAHVYVPEYRFVGDSPINMA